MRHRLRASVQRVCPARLANDLDDIVQTAVMRVVEALRGRGREDPVPSSYLRKAAFSAAVDEIRRHDRRGEMALPDDPADGPYTASDPGPEREHAAGEIRRALSACLAALSAPRRRMVTLYLLGHTVPEASRMLGWTLRKAEHLVYRGLEDLRRCLTSRGIRP